MGRDLEADEALAEAYNRGLVLEKAGDLDAAAAAYREALRLDPEDHGGVSVRLAAIGRGAAPAGAPAAYVATLFDQQAEMFEAILVDRLGYDVPTLLARRLAPLGPFARALDLGCGTGLVADALAAAALRPGHLAGVDLAEGMLEIAEEKGLYDTLYLGDAVEFLAAADDPEDPDDGAPPAAFDLVVAADVLPYLGPVEPLFTAVAGSLAPGGVWAFSTETPPVSADGPDWSVGAAHRFAHRPDYLARALAARGMAVLSAEPITVRFERGARVPGELIVARKDMP